ncbi:MAG: hypothetical protein L6R40_005474 [Gallowayella cf. fulva]|nr:MAG: hypothetical protein L6R40_005474 [Xanthomendoza cf. fulva]
MEKGGFDAKPRVHGEEIASIQWTSSWGSAASVDKPLPCAPEFTGLQSHLAYAKATLRSLGLNVVVYVLQHCLGVGLDEIPKRAFHRDRIMALVRSIVHVLPFTVALGEIIVNWRGYYVGANFDGLSYLQFAAKLHEMAMQSSLAVILYGYVRHVLFSGDALPIGALLSGLQLTQVSYLWSMELWGIASSKIPLHRRLVVMTVIIVAVSLASTVGPSSAILLIPNLSYWPAGSTHIWINITASDLWPSRLDGSLLPSSCSQASNVSNICPASEWHSISDYLSLANGMIPPSFLGSFTVSPYFVPLTGQGSLRQLIIQHHMCDNETAPYDQMAAQATTQHGVVADALSATSSLWALALQNSDSPFFDQRDAVQSIVEDNFQPYTLASCGADVIEDEADDRPVAFPIPPGSSLDMLSKANVTLDTMLPMFAIEYPGLTRSEILRTPGSKSDYRIRWVELPEDPFNGSSIGAVILQPKTNETQGILLCNVAAGWGSSSMNMSSSPAASGTGLTSSSIYDPESSLAQANDYSRRTAESVLRYKLPLFPQRKINISGDWAQYLNPQIPTMNTTVINALMARKLKDQDDSTSANIILAGLLANGLSRTGFNSQLQGEIRTIFKPTINASIPDGDYWFSGRGDVFTVDPSASRDWVRLRVDSFVEGYGFGLDGFAPKLTAAVLLLYCALVSAHVVYTLISGVSSTSWDSITEMVALAVNSSPTIHLRNTCAGVAQMGVFALPVRVLVCKDAGGGGGGEDDDHLEMVFGSVEESVARRGRVRENREYGTLPRCWMEDDERDFGRRGDGSLSCRLRRSVGGGQL